MAVIIRKLTATKGFLAGLSIEPAPGFTVIIGHPGAFKSTIVETTRWALNRDAERIRERMAPTLGGGVARCDLTVDGEACALERGSGWDSPSAVPLGKRPIALDAVGAAIYSQGELRQLADHVERRLALLDAANESRMQELADHAREATRAHENACALLRPKRKEIEDLVQDVSALESLKARIDAHRKEKPRVDPRLDAEREKHDARAKLLERVAKGIPKLEEAIAEIARQGDVAALARDLGKALGEHDAAPAEKLAELLSKAAKAIDDACRGVDKVDLKSSPSLLEKLAHAFQERDRPYLKLTEGEKGLSEWTRTEAKLKKELADLESKADQLSVARKEEKRLLGERAKAADELEAFRRQVSDLREAEVAEIAKWATKGVKVKLVRDGSRGLYVEALQRIFSGKSASRQKGLVPLLAESFTPRELARLVETEGGGTKIDAVTGGTNGERLAGHILEHETFLDLERIPLDDRLDVSLVQGGVEKSIETLSKGQSAVALLSLILRPGAIPIIFDQVEDDLDASFIVEIAARIRELKKKTQVIVVTRDANLVVLGEADKVIVMGAETPTQALIKKTGTVDECTDEILRLEGGREAFQARAEQYGFER